MIIANELRPICFICNKFVEKIEMVEDFRTRHYYIAVECHGEKETMEMSREFVMDNNLQRGYAFYQPKLEEQKKLQDPAFYCQYCGGDYPGSCYKWD